MRHSGARRTGAVLLIHPCSPEATPKTAVDNEARPLRRKRSGGLGQSMYPKCFAVTSRLAVARIAQRVTAPST
jgi:hypothetical protein